MRRFSFYINFNSKTIVDDQPRNAHETRRFLPSRLALRRRQKHDTALQATFLLTGPTRQPSTLLLRRAQLQLAEEIASHEF